MQSIAEQVCDFTKYKLRSISNRSDPAIRAALANLRRGVGRIPGEMPELYGEFLENMPETMYSKGNEPSYAEWAVYTAVTLYALHQQSKDIHTKNMNQENISLGEAVSRLASKEDDREGGRERIWRRFYSVVSSDDMQEMSYHLRGMIQLLRNKDIPLDYSRLARELFMYQCSKEQADSIRLKWGQDFYRKHINENEENSND